MRKSNLRSLAKTSDCVIRTNLFRWLEIATVEQMQEGVNWYLDANRWVWETANKYSIHPQVVANVCSMLSPNNKWHWNMDNTETMINAWLNGKSIESFKVTTYGQNKEKAWRYLRDEFDLIYVKSPKTFSFAKNLMMDDDYVTIDMWMIRALLQNPQRKKKEISLSLPLTQYNRCVKLFKDTAEQLALSPIQLQASVWTAVREIY